MPKLGECIRLALDDVPQYRTFKLDARDVTACLEGGYEDLEWVACPECLLLVMRPRRWRGVFSCPCKYYVHTKMVWLGDYRPELAAVLESTLRVGGVWAVDDILREWDAARLMNFYPTER